MTGIALDHVQIAIPAGGEDDARQFFGVLLGLAEVDKPEALQARGGLWFELDGGVGFHLGVDAAFRPATRAHAGLRLGAFDAALARLETAGVAVQRDVDSLGRRRAYLHDPFGSRLELIEGT